MTTFRPSGATLRLVVVLAMTFLSLLYALWGIELHKVTEALTGMRLWLLLPVAAMTTAVFMARVLRFHLLLGDVRPTLRRQIVVCGISFLAINVVPLRLGEFVRPFMLLEDDVPWGRSLGAVVMERVVDLCMLLSMLSMVSFFVDLPATIMVQGVDVLSAGQQAIGFALLLLIGGLSAVVIGGLRVAVLFERIPVIGFKVAGFGLSFRESVFALFSKPLQAAAVFLLGAMVWSGTIVIVKLLLLAMPGMPTSWSVALAVTAVTVAGTVAIPTPGFFGPFEVFCKATLVLWAVEPSFAAAFAVLWHLIAFGFHVVTGSALLVQQGVSLTGLVRGSQEAHGA